jgi:hypothetical protein
LRVFHTALRLPRLPPNGTMIQLHEFKGLVEVRRAKGHFGGTPNLMSTQNTDARYGVR